MPVEGCSPRPPLYAICAAVYPLPMEERERDGAEPRPAGASPAALGRKAVEDLLARDGFMRYDVGDVHALHYAEACAALGAARLSGLLGEARALERIAARYAPEGLPPNTANHVDANVYGVLPLELSLRLGPGHPATASLRDQGLAFADGQWADPRPDGLTSQTRYWIDDMYMIASLQAQAFRVTGKGVYLERAALELDAYVRKLQRPNGLFFHGSEAPHFWGRGNGWVAAGLAELLSVLEPSDPHRESLKDAFGKMMEALLRYQAEDGMWRQLIDHDEAWKETSSTAMFGYAMALGAAKGFLPGPAYGRAAEKAWRALASYVDESGRLREVCAGTGQEDDVAFYLARPRVVGDLHGQAALLWFASALIEAGN
jgi:unsaturated rhamnogalacturonyl hydrolase